MDYKYTCWISPLCEALKTAQANKTPTPMEAVNLCSFLDCSFNLQNYGRRENGKKLVIIGNVKNSKNLNYSIYE